MLVYLALALCSVVIANNDEDFYFKESDIVRENEGSQQVQFQALRTKKGKDSEKEEFDQIVILFKDGLYVLFDIYGWFLCVDDDFLDQSYDLRKYEGLPFCEKPRIRIPKRCNWDVDTYRELRVRTYTLRCGSFGGSE